MYRAKLKLAAYWASSCGGCDVSILDLHEGILDVAAMADIVFWPLVVDSKYADIEAMEDGAIDLCLFNGAIRNTEGLHVARELRRCSKILVAYGTCASFGGVPGLANLASREEVFDQAFHDSPSMDNLDRVVPVPSFEREGRTVKLPAIFDAVLPLVRVVEVDYVMPGCPPKPERLAEVVELIKSGDPLPPRGATIGAGVKSLCDTCERTKSEGLKIKRFYRPFEKVPEPETCLLEQGFLCLGSATRDGCGHRCINAQIPCRGCYGPLEGVKDAGARFLSAVAAQIDATEPEEIERILDTIPDPTGTFYRYSLPSATIWRAIKP